MWQLVRTVTRTLRNLGGGWWVGGGNPLNYYIILNSSSFEYIIGNSSMLAIKINPILSMSLTHTSGLPVTEGRRPELLNSEQWCFSNT